MVSIEQMKNAEKKKIKLSLTDGEVFEEKCTNYYQQEDDDEEPMLEFGDILINQSEIKSIEILD